MATSKYIGLIDCPICSSSIATVHEQQTGTKKGRLYYRCYTEINGSTQRCGTIQCTGPKGQDFIRAHMRPIAPPEPVAAPIAQPEPVPKPEIRPIAPPEPKPAPIAPVSESAPKRAGLFSGFASSEGE